MQACFCVCKYVRTYVRTYYVGMYVGVCMYVCMYVSHSQSMHKNLFRRYVIILLISCYGYAIKSAIA